VQVYQIRIRELRQDSDKTQQEVADYLGINQTVYARYENAKADMKIFNLVKLCQYYGVSADYIIGLPKGLKWLR